MIAIGGYFGLELGHGNEFHIDAIRLNTGRNALEYILLNKNYQRIFIPYYTCDVLLQPIERMGIKFEYYHIDDCFEPVFNYEHLKESDVFLYTNYFGLKTSFVDFLIEKKINIIIDSAQAFYARPKSGIDTFYSARKFFGVPDGAYLYTKQSQVELEQDHSYERFSHLLKRVDISAELGYSDFVFNENLLDNISVKKMSNLTHRILDSIDYEACASTRIANYKFINNAIGDINILKIKLSGNDVPMAYPFLTDNFNLRDELISNKIYVPLYWQNVKKLVSAGQWEHNLAKNLIPIPIDQRLSIKELNRIIKLAKK
jgi:hypothetical protein